MTTSQMENKKETETLLPHNRLRWGCRRGMLELDIFLGCFMDFSYDDLTYEDKVIFQNLLLEADQTLLAYFMGQEKPIDPEISRVIEKIRHAASA
jgi:antitoxin CptB